MIVHHAAASPTKADLQISFSSSQFSRLAGDAISFSMYVANAGPNNATGIKVTDVFPVALTNVSYEGINYGGATGANSGSGNLNDTVTLASGSHILYVVSATISPTATGDIPDTATVTPPPGVTDPKPGNNTATATIVLTDLAHIVQAADTVQLGGEGFGNAVFAPDGSLAELLYIDQVLYYRVRDASGQFTAEKVGPAFTPEIAGVMRPRADDQAQLLFASDGTPHVLVADGGSVDHYRRGTAGWQLVESVSLGTSGPERIFHLASAIGSDNSLHFAATVGSGDGLSLGQAGRLIYGTNASGSWVIQQAAAQASITTYDYFSAGYRRYVSLALDAENHAYIAYVPEINSTGHNGVLDEYSELVCATNASGTWTTQIVDRPAGNSADGGAGACIAVGPKGEIGIAEFFIQRVPTGSASYAKLVYHQLRADGTWSTETVASAPDGYVAGDGPRFTGFAPDLVFDAQDRPNIAFSDYASQHFGAAGADEFAGQIRWAVKNAARWTTRTVLRQTNPLKNEMLYPTLVLSATEAFFMGLRRADQLDSHLNIIQTDYYLAQVSVPLPGAPGPAVSISAPSVATTTGGPVSFTVTYTDSAFGHSTLTAANVKLITTGTVKAKVSVSPGKGATRTVTISHITGSGTLAISIAAGTAVDSAGNEALAAGPSVSVTVV
ncbi:MAG: DUF11 domain-containing protein [Thermoguttaceae bacterium]|jgi:uncharacterized repeat protein (TIGR01451 family)